jgi:hypothetical protein
MLRFLYVASLVGILLITPAANGDGDGSSMGPSQALVRINASGQLEMVSRASKMVAVQRQQTVMKKELRTETRTETRTIEKDGKPEQVTREIPVTVEIMVPTTMTYTEMKTVYETAIKAFPASTNGFRRDADKAEIPLFDLAGNRLSVSAVEDRLHDWTLVLISNTGKPLDRKFAGLFKPTTIVIGVPPYQPLAMPAYPAPQPPTVAPQPIPQPAPVPPSAAREDRPALSPVAFLASDTTPQLPNAPEPAFAFAKVWGEKTLALRTETEKTIDLSCPVTKVVDRLVDGKMIKVNVCEPHQLEKVIEIRETIRYPLADVAVTRTPNKELTKSELPSVLSVEVLAMVSADGKPVDLLWQRNLRDGALVIVVPAASTAMPAPMMMPTTMPPAPAASPAAPAPGSPGVLPPPAPSPAPAPAT